MSNLQRSEKSLRPDGIERQLRTLEQEECRRSAQHFIFDSGKLLTKDEHDAREPVKPAPDIPYLRVLLDAYLVSGRLVAPEDAKWALESGIPLDVLARMYQTGMLLVEKSRDVFVTNLTCAYCHWRARALPHQLILMQSKKEEDAASLVFVKEPQFARISFMEDHLPKHLRQFAWPKGGAFGHLYAKNGSHIRAIPEGGDIIRSEHPSVIVCDEAAFQPEFGASFTAALPACEGGGQYIAVSSADPGEWESIVEANAETTPTRIPGLGWRLASGTIPVLQVHYSADPAKRPGTAVGDAWREQAAARYPGGINSPRWKKEMEMDYGALGGTKLFPDWEKWCRGPIVCDPFIPTGYRLYASYDHGWRNPASFHIHGISATDVVTFWEFYASQVPVHLIAKIILGEPVSTQDGRRFPGNPFAGQQLYIIADPSMWAEDVPMTDETNKSVAELFRRAGVYMTKGERGGDTMVAEWLHGHYWRDPAQPLYRICSTCPKLIWEIGKLRHKEFSAKVALTRDQPEQFVSKDDHAWDGLKMFLQRFPPKPGMAPAVAPPATFSWWKQVAQKAQHGETLPTYRRQVVA